MRPKERRDGSQTDLLQARLDQILNMDHALVKLAAAIDWRFLEERLGEVYDDDPGRPPLPTRLMAGLAILKSMHNLSAAMSISQRVLGLSGRVDIYCPRVAFA